MKISAELHQLLSARVALANVLVLFIRRDDHPLPNPSKRRLPPMTPTKKRPDTLSSILRNARFYDKIHAVFHHSKRNRPIGFLLPDGIDGAERVFEYLFDLYDQCAAEYGLSGDEFCKLVSIAYYAPDCEDPSLIPCSARLQDFNEYVTRHQKEFKHRFESRDLPKLGFLYALGVDRHRTTFPGEHERWGAIWAPAVASLQLEVEDLANMAKRQVSQYLGSSDIAAEALVHSTEVLLGERECPCEINFSMAHRNAARHVIRERHDHCHVLSGYLSLKSWPRKYQRADVYPVSQFIYRALVGAPVKHANGFEKSVFFPLIRVLDQSLVNVKVLACRETVTGKTNGKRCNSTEADFTFCPKCKTTNPELGVVQRIVRKDDPQLEEVEVWRCRCKRLCSTKNTACEQCRGDDWTGNPKKPGNRKPTKYYRLRSSYAPYP